MTKTEILENLQDQMFNHYRDAFYWERQLDEDRARLKALRDADGVFWTGLALLGGKWSDRLVNARSQAINMASYEFQN